MIVAIDPSLLSLGYAIFDASTELTDYGTVEDQAMPRGAGRKVGILEARISSIISALDKKLKPALSWADSGLMLIEKPQPWGAYKSVASMHSGALLGLIVLTGALYWYGVSNGYTVRLIPVSKWKGQLPKRVTQRRMEKEYSVKFKTDDEADAVGLGNWFIKENVK